MELTNRMIAERAGWQVQWKSLDVGMKVRGLNRAWFVTPPAGDAERIDEDGEDAGGYFVSQAETEDEAWENYTRNYLASVDAALTLPLPTARYQWHLRGSGTGWTAEIWDGGWNETEAQASTPAEAFCVAWWNWQEHKALSER